MNDPIGSTRPHRARPSAQALDDAFEAHKGIEHVRHAHALYVECAIVMLRAARRMEAMNEAPAAAAMEALIVLCEQQAKRHIEAIAARLAANGGAADGGGGAP